MIKRYYIVLLLLMPIFLDGCRPPEWYNKKYNATRVYKLLPADSKHEREEVQIEKSYNIGTIGTARVGQPLVSRKAFLVKINGRLMASPLINTTLGSETLTVYLDSNKLYPVRFNTAWDGRPFNIAEVPHPHGEGTLGIMFDNNGRLNDRILRVDREYPRKFNVSPSNAVIRTTYQEELVSRQQIEDYEVIYGGIENGEIKLLYRDNDPTNRTLGKAALAQQLSYPIGSSLIRYKALTMKIHGANKGRISYEVIED